MTHGLIETTLKGYKITFYTCGVSQEQADKIWSILTPTKLTEYLKNTAHNHLVWEEEGLCISVKQGRGDNITVHCGVLYD